MSTILVNNIKDTGNNTLFTSDGSGNISSGGALTNTPAFLAYVSSNQDMTDETTTKANLDTTQIDTNSAFDTTNNKFTVPSGQAGTYYLHAQAVIGNADGSRTRASGGGASIGYGNETHAMVVEKLDSPSTTSSLTYKVQVAAIDGDNFIINYTIVDSNSSTYSRHVSSITVMEIGA